MATAEKARRGPRDYVKRRGRIWQVRFQYPDALRESAMDLYGMDKWPSDKGTSLETDDELEARRRAQPYITAHLELLLYHKARSDPAHHWADIAGSVWEMQPDTEELKPDGTHIVASVATITTIHPDRRVESRVNRKRPVIDYTAHAWSSKEGQAVIESKAKLDARKYNDVDGEMVERYLDGRFGVRHEDSGKRPRPDKGDIGLVRSTLASWRDFSQGKLLKNASRAEVAGWIKSEIDGRATDEQPLAGLERVKKGAKFLIAAINSDMKDASATSFQYNPFADPNWSIYDMEYQKRNTVEFDESDISKIKKNMSEFTKEEYLMIALHCATSVRPGCLYSVIRDEWLTEDEYDSRARLVASHKVRVFFIEKDKDPTGRFMKRRLPFPQDILDATWLDGSSLLPDRIVGGLFTTPAADLNRDVNAKLRTIGVATEEPLKRLYSGRHRARRRLNSCLDTDIRRYIMGHSHRRRDPHNEYGGYPAHEVKPWIDIIRF